MIVDGHTITGTRLLCNSLGTGSWGITGKNRPICRYIQRYLHASSLYVQCTLVLSLGGNQFSLTQLNTMPNKPVVIYLILWLFQIQNIYTYKDDEHYCQGVFDSYSYCRKCPNATMFCEAQKSCRCDNIEIYSTHRK